jgi:ACT domain-containing protein
MMIQLEALIEDKPGALIRMLAPISENDCDIQRIQHGQKRDEENLIPVAAQFELAAARRTWNRNSEVCTYRPDREERETEKEGNPRCSRWGD